MHSLTQKLAGLILPPISKYTQKPKLEYYPLWTMVIGLFFILATGCGKDNDLTKIPMEPKDNLIKSRNDLSSGVHGVGDITFGSPIDDLTPLGDIVGDATVVGIGESRHDTHGFGRARAQVIRYLIEEKGFRAIGYEAAWTITERLANEYIHGADLTLEDGLNGLQFTTWKTPTTGELLQWLRAWNNEHPDDDVVMFGFDLQNVLAPETILRDNIRALVDAGTLTTHQKQAFFEGIANCPGSKYETIQELSADPDELAYIFRQTQFPELRFLACQDAMDLLKAELVNLFVGDDQVIIQAAIRSLEGFNGQIFYWITNNGQAMNARDAGMADLFELFQTSYSLLDGRKIINVAHNVHNQRRSDELTEVGFFIPPLSMGTLLEDRLGSDYVPLGFFARKVVFDFQHAQPQGNDPNTFVVTSNEALEKIIFKDLVGNGFDHAIVNLTEATAPNALFQPGQNYEFGMFALWSKGIPLNHFDGVFFMKEAILDE